MKSFLSKKMDKKPEKSKGLLRNSSKTSTIKPAPKSNSECSLLTNTKKDGDNSKFLIYL